MQWIVQITLASPPAGAAVDPVTRVFSLIPTESQGPDTDTVIALDSGLPSLSVINQFTVTVLEVNSSPVLTALADRVVHEGMMGGRP